MKKKIVITIVEDHQLIVNCIISSLSNSHDKKYTFSFKKTIDPLINSEFFESSDSLKDIDLMFLDYAFSSSKKEHLYTGKEIGVFIRENFPRIKIIICTSVNSSYVLSNLIHNINPEGFLLKEDIDSNDIIEATKKVLEGHIFYSPTITLMLKNRLKLAFEIDQLDIKLLNEIAKVSNTNEIMKLLPLSRSSIDRRKRKLKTLLKLDILASDRELIKLAKQEKLI